ncbi:MAG: OadG family protein [Clostridiales bacterium]|nr:OadG family protein [Clostridiales bacterium]
MNFSDVASLLHTADLTVSGKGIASAKVILTGFVVVFSVLVILIFIIKIYSAIVSKAQQTGKKKKIKVKEPEQPTTAKTEIEVPAPAPLPVENDGIPEEVVAVISAAVATMYDSPEKAKIKSIKKSGGGRSAWANAGVLDNTRPF